MSRFILQQSQDKENYYFVTDQDNEIVIEFQKGKFNETQKITELNNFNPNDFMKIARIMREIGEYLYQEHQELLF
jgi:hypothetical protein